MKTFTREGCVRQPDQEIQNPLINVLKTCIQNLFTITKTYIHELCSVWWSAKRRDSCQ